MKIEKKKNESYHSTDELYQPANKIPKSNSTNINVDEILQNSILEETHSSILEIFFPQATRTMPINESQKNLCREFLKPLEKKFLDKLSTNKEIERCDILLESIDELKKDKSFADCPPFYKNFILDVYSSLKKESDIKISLDFSQKNSI